MMCFVWKEKYHYGPIYYVEFAMCQYFYTYNLEDISITYAIRSWYFSWLVKKRGWRYMFQCSAYSHLLLCISVLIEETESIQSIPDALKIWAIYVPQFKGKLVNISIWYICLLVLCLIGGPHVKKLTSAGWYRFH